MRRMRVVACPLVLSFLLCACNGLTAITRQDYAGTPTVYAVVNKEPNPLLVGCYLRSRPSEFRKPNMYEFCIVKDGDRYAMFYFMMNGKTKTIFKDWTAAVIDGDSVTSDYDASRFFVKDGAVWQMTTTGGPYHMLRSN
jgi:hypothetical protein